MESSAHNLPIDIIPGSRPLRFRWRHIVDTMAGKQTVPCEGVLSVSAEEAVAALINIVKLRDGEIETLRKVNQGLVDRVAAQAELLEKRAEKVPELPVAKKGK